MHTNLFKQTWFQEIDWLLLFSLVPGITLLALLQANVSNGLRAWLMIGFLCFYPGYLLVRRTNVNGLFFKLFLSIGLSFTLVTCMALLALSFGRWSPVNQSVILILIVFTDILFGQRSILYYCFPFLDPSSFRFRDRPQSTTIYQDPSRPVIRPIANEIWQIEYLKIKSYSLQKEVELVVISDLITQECLTAIPYLQGHPNQLTHHLSWLFIKRDYPTYLEFHHFDDLDTKAFLNWLTQTSPEIIFVPPVQNYPAQLHDDLAQFINQHAYPDLPIHDQLKEWVKAYNQSLKASLYPHA